MTNPNAALGDSDFVNALLNLLIPPSAEAPSSASRDLPGAGELGVGAAVVASIQADPLLGPMVEAGAQAVREAALSQQPEGLAGMTPQAGAKLLEDQLAAHPLLIMGILRHLYPAYYQHPQILVGIGEPPRPPFPEGFELEATDPKLLEKLQARRKTE